jgi:dATP/dGTP diphosphohydrolase
MADTDKAPTRATTLPDEPAARKRYPIATGVLEYFPDALVAVSHVSFKGNEQHNPGQPLHWARGKSMDQADTLIRHFLQRGSRDTDGLRHSAKMAWRALAILQLEIEADQHRLPPVGVIRSLDNFAGVEPGTIVEWDPPPQQIDLCAHCGEKYNRHTIGTNRCPYRTTTFVKKRAA